METLTVALHIRIVIIIIITISVEVIVIMSSLNALRFQYFERYTIIRIKNLITIIY